MSNMERRPASTLDGGVDLSRFGTKEQIETLSRKAVKELDADRPDPRAFVALYGPQVEKDIADAERKEWENRKADQIEGIHDISKLSEYFFYKQVQSIAGDRVKIKPTAHVDDQLKKTDFVLDCDPKNSIGADQKYHAGSIDVVLGKGGSMTKKFMNILDSISAGKALVELKYFKPLGRNKTKTSLVRGIVSFPEDMTISFISMYSANDTEGIKNHYAPYAFFTQLSEQYFAFYQYAKYVKKPEIAKEYLDAYLKLSSFFDPLSKEMESKPDLKALVDKDEGVAYVRGFIRLMKSQYMPGMKK